LSPSTRQTVLVTGASRGLGSAIALAFGRTGARVYVGYKNREREATDTVHGVEAAGGQAAALAFDVVLFDQRGCLSPRVVLFEGSRTGAQRLAIALADALRSWEVRVPRGQVSLDERAECTRYADTLTYTGEIVPAGSGMIGITPGEGALLLPPAGRNLHVIPVADAIASAENLSAHVTTFAVSGSDAQESALAQSLPSARPAKLGMMQCPAFDGPVDRRAPARSALTTFFNSLGRAEP